MKVGKEEIVGLVAAVERYVSLDHDAERRELDARAELISGVLGSVSGLSLETHVPEIANHVPHVVVNWDEGGLGVTSEDAVARLLEGDPPIAVSRSGEGRLRISTVDAPPRSGRRGGGARQGSVRVSRPG